MDGSALRRILAALPHAKLTGEDNNQYLLAYRLDTGAELAFDPRTTTKCSIFVEHVPERMRSRLGKVHEYRPAVPSTALGRVSRYLDGLPRVYRIEIPDEKTAADLIEWIRWA